MKFILVIAGSLLSCITYAQLNFNFDKRFVECEDQWVAFNSNKDSSYSFGFIYIDPEAGLTLNHEGYIKMKEDNSFEVLKDQEFNLKLRLEPNNVKVAIIPENLFQKLDIKAIPDWLQAYKKDANTAAYFFRKGFLYNAWQECEKAIPQLLKAKEIDAFLDGLDVEIAYAYNCLGNYEKAVEVLEGIVKLNPTDAYINKEYIYSLTKNKSIDKAIVQYNTTLKSLKENTYNAENCFNILQYYYYIKDKKNFKKWYKEMKRWPSQNELMMKYANNMKQQL